MKAIHYYIGMAGMAALLLSSCVKDELHDTPHPDKGMVAVTADWTDRGENIPVPEKWTVSIGDYTGEETAASHTPNYLFEPGNYTLAAYNLPEGITISGTTATVAADQDNTGCIAGQPGWLFTSVQSVTIEADRDHEFTAKMRQQVRQLTLVLEVTGGSADRIESIEGTLSGIAGTLDVDDGTHGTPSNIRLSFAKDTDGKFKCTVRLLGIAGTEQTLTAEIRYKDGTPSSVSLTSDLTDDLADFNTDKKTPLTLGGEVVETPDAAGFTATIDDWQPIKGGSVVAD